MLDAANSDSAIISADLASDVDDLACLKTSLQFADQLIEADETIDLKFDPVELLYATLRCSKPRRFFFRAFVPESPRLLGILTFLCLAKKSNSSRISEHLGKNWSLSLSKYCLAHITAPASKNVLFVGSPSADGRTKAHF